MFVVETVIRASMRKPAFLRHVGGLPHAPALRMAWNHPLSRPRTFGPTSGGLDGRVDLWRRMKGPVDDRNQDGHDESGDGNTAAGQHGEPPGKVSIRIFGDPRR